MSVLEPTAKLNTKTQRLQKKKKKKWLYSNGKVIKKFVGCCRRIDYVFDHFIGLALTGLKTTTTTTTTTKEDTKISNI